MTKNTDILNIAQYSKEEIDKIKQGITDTPEQERVEYLTKTFSKGKKQTNLISEMIDLYHSGPELFGFAMDSLNADQKLEVLTNRVSDEKYSTLGEAMNSKRNSMISALASDAQTECEEELGSRAVTAFKEAKEIDKGLLQLRKSLKAQEATSEPEVDTKGYSGFLKNLSLRKNTDNQPSHLPSDYRKPGDKGQNELGPK